PKATPSTKTTRKPRPKRPPSPTKAKQPATEPTPARVAHPPRCPGTPLSQNDDNDNDTDDGQRPAREIPRSLPRPLRWLQSMGARPRAKPADDDTPTSRRHHEPPRALFPMAWPDLHHRPARRHHHAPDP